jgi:hypothetical protein
LAGEIRATLLAATTGALAASTPAVAFDYVAGVDVHGQAEGGVTAKGVVFLDRSHDGRRQEGEPGVAGVIVSNGRDVTVTDAEGRYELPVFDNMTLMVTKPAGYATPTDENGVPQFFYHHKPEGTPEVLRYGGLAPTGPLPAEVNFPLVERVEPEAFRCVAMADTQPYANQEVGWVRDGVLASLVVRDDLADVPCLILLGDVVGDDLGLLPRMMDIFSVLGMPQYYIHGNHDYDFDATQDAHSADSWRRLYGPNYYSFEIGRVFFVALDNVIYPCTAEDHAEDDRAACGVEGEAPIYNGRVNDDQMRWLDALLAEVPEDRLVVLMSHIPLVSFFRANSGRHQTDNAAAIHALLEDRPALSLSGHAHTLEYLVAGESFAGWKEKTGVASLPFTHHVAGAASGNFFMGDFGFDGTPLAFARDGSPPGYLTIDFAGADYTITFHAANQPEDRQMALSFNTPLFRAWFAQAYEFARNPGDPEAVPPVTVHDLDDLKLFTPHELSEGVWLTANVWNGTRDTRVEVRIDGGEPMLMERTQPGEGEAQRRGVDYADPFVLQRQMTVGRNAWQSESGDPRTQGFEIWQGTSFGPRPPRSIPAWALAVSSSHLWRLRLPEDLAEGAHVAEVTAIDRAGLKWTDRIVFEVRGERPPRFWRRELWE